MKMDTISIKDINLKKLIISKYGKHYSQDVHRILKLKNEDIAKLGYCLWAHSNKLSNIRTFEFCEEIEKKDNKDIYVLLPYTESEPGVKNGIDKKGDVMFKKYGEYIGNSADDKDSVNNKDKYKYVELPVEMNEVRGSKFSNAFYISELYTLEEDIDFDSFYKYYMAKNLWRDRPAEETLKSSCPGRCIELKENYRHMEEEVIKKKITEDVISKDNTKKNIKKALVAKLKSPYQVIMKKEEYSVGN